jgi:hypothetical protein
VEAPIVHRDTHDGQEIGHVNGVVHLDLTNNLNNRVREMTFHLTTLRRGCLARIYVGDLDIFETAPDTLEFIAEAVANGVDVSFEGSHRAIARWMYEAYHEARRIVQARRPQLRVVDA